MPFEKAKESNALFWTLDFIMRVEYRYRFVLSCKLSNSGYQSGNIKGNH